MTDTSAVTAVGSQAFRVTTAFGNTGLGAQAGAATTTGLRNTAVGAAALFSNVTGSDNVAVGRSALILATANDNTAVGANALDAATSGASNTAVGRNALGVLTTGSNNVALGRDAGLAVTTGSRMTLVGDNADAGGGALVNATALGALARVDQDNSVVLGSTNGVNGATASTRVGIGTTTPEAQVDLLYDATISGDTLQATRHEDSGAGPVVTFRKTRGTRAAPTGVLNGDNLLFLRATGHNGAAISATGRATLFAEATEDWTVTANGTRWAFFTTQNGTTGTLERLRIDHDGQVGIGTTDPLATLHVAGTVRVDSLGTAGATALCRNASNEIATCSSSLRYKRDVEAFDGGLKPDRPPAADQLHLEGRWAARCGLRRGGGGRHRSAAGRIRRGGRGRGREVRPPDDRAGQRHQGTRAAREGA